MKPVIICYHCRKRVSEQEIAAGLHSHFEEPGPRDKQLVPAVENKATN
jgi:hypothetical protein